MSYEKSTSLNQESCIYPPYYFYFWVIALVTKKVKFVCTCTIEVKNSKGKQMLKLAELAELKQEGLKFI